MRVMGFSVYGLLVGLATALVWLSMEKILKTTSAAQKWPESTWNLGLLLIAACALIGARIYHLATDWHIYADAPWPAALQIWNGGLGWYGGMIGILAGIALWRRWQKPAASWLQILDSFALALPFGQALGRWGNYFNQELFGPPTTLPWGIFIDVSRRPEIWQNAERFHPLFLYESLGNILLGTGLFLLWKWTARSKSEAPWPQLGSGAFLAFYGLGSGCLRFSLDFLRHDLALSLWNLTVSQWFALALIGGSLAVLQQSFRYWLSSLVTIASVFTAGVLLLHPPLAQAQQPAIDLSVVPAVVEITVQPGKSVTRAFTLKNSGTTNLTATVVLQEFASDGNSGTPVLTGDTTFPYAKLVNADRALNEPFPFPAGGEQQIVLSLNIPEDAQERDWYLVLLTKTESTDVTPALTSQASSRGAIGATVLVRVSRTETMPLQWGITFPKLPRFFDSLRPLPIDPLVENTNPSMAVPDLTVSVRDWRGKQVLSQDGLPERVLANSTRFMRAQKTSLDDPRSLEPTPFVFDPAFAIGRYTVEARITNQAGEPLVVQQVVWGVPLSVLVVVLGAGFASVWMHILAQRKKNSAG